MTFPFPAVRPSVPSLSDLTDMWLNGGSAVRNILGAYALNATSGRFADEYLTTGFSWVANTGTAWSSHLTNRYATSNYYTLSPESLPSDGNADDIIPRTTTTTVVMINYAPGTVTNSYSGSYSSTESVSVAPWYRVGMDLFHVDASYDQLGSQTYSFTHPSVDKNVKTQSVLWLPGKYTIHESDGALASTSASLTTSTLQANDILLHWAMGLSDAWYNAGTISWSGGSGGTLVDNPYSNWYDNFDRRMYMVTDSQSATLSRSADNYANAYIVLRPEYA